MRIIITNLNFHKKQNTGLFWRKILAETWNRIPWNFRTLRRPRSTVCKETWDLIKASLLFSVARNKYIIIDRSIYLCLRTSKLAESRWALKKQRQIEVREPTDHCSTAAYPCHECRNPRGPTFYYRFKEYIVIASARGHVSLTTFSAVAAAAAAAVVVCPCTPRAKTGPPLRSAAAPLRLSSIPSHLVRDAREKEYLHVIYIPSLAVSSLVDYIRMSLL